MSLRLKTILGVASIEAVLLAILLSLTLNYLKETNFDGLDQRAYSTSNLFASTVKNAVLSYDLATVDSFTQELLHNDDITYVAVFDAEGQLLSGAGELPSLPLADHIEPSSSQVKDGIFDISSTIEESGIEFGQVHLGFDMTTLNTAINSAKKWSTLIVIGEMSLVALFSYFLGAYLTRRLSKLRQAADDIATGARSIDIQDDGRDELATVSRAFNNMVAQIKASEDKAERYHGELEESNANLESRVLKRTKALTDANHKLTETNQRLKNTKEKLVESEKLASIGTMAAGVAHEINNPMGAVSSNLQMCQTYLNTYQTWVDRSEALHDQTLEDGIQDLSQWKEEQYVDSLEEDFRDSLGEALASADRVRSIVTALQHYASQLDQEKTEREFIFIKPVLAQCLKALSLPKQFNIKLHPSLNTLPQLNVHPDEFKQLLTEILKNATQACERNTENNEYNVSVSTKIDSQRLLIQVLDNGPGIEEKHLKRLYDPFFTTLPVGQGMGLGLTFAYNIVRHHKGAIHIQNRETGGAAVTLGLPLSIMSKSTPNPLSKREESEA